MGFDEEFLSYLRGFRFKGDVDAMPEGTIAFANEPLVRVTAPRIEAQLIETLLLNQINFQTMIATKAARVVLAANGAGEAIVDFSPRRDHGVDAAMKAARASAIAGVGGTSNVAAAMRYGLRPVGTMAHSYVMSFEREQEAFEAFMRDNPENAVLLVDTYDTIEGVRRAIEASRRTGIPLAGVRLDSGDLPTLAAEARHLLDGAGMGEARIVASGDLEERRIAELCRAKVPIDLWGVGTDLGTSRDSPVVNGVYKIVADLRGGLARGGQALPRKGDPARREAGLPAPHGWRDDRGHRRGGRRGAGRRTPARSSDERWRNHPGGDPRRDAGTDPPEPSLVTRGPRGEDGKPPYPVRNSERLTRAARAQSRTE